MVGRNSLNLLRYFSYHIPGFYTKQQTLDDLYNVCDRLGIMSISLALIYLHGCAFYENGFPYLFINNTLSQSEQVIAGFHELAHLLFHPLDACEFSSAARLWNLSKAERQAQSVGVLALMPPPLVVGMTAEDMMREFDISRKTAEFRLSV